MSTVPKLKEVLTTSNTESETLDWRGGEGVFGGTGTYSGATLSMEVSFDGTNWMDIGSDYDIDGSNATAFAFNFLPVCKLRLSISGGDGSTSITGYIQ